MNNKYVSDPKHYVSWTSSAAAKDVTYWKNNDQQTAIANLSGA